MDPGGSEAIEAAERNYLAAWRLLVTNAEGCRIEETDALLVTVVPDAPTFFNSAFVKPPADPLACIEAASTCFDGRPFTLRFRDDEETAARCLAVGFDDVGQSPLMNAVVADVAPATDADVRRVRAGLWSDHLAAVAAGFGLPTELTHRLFAPRLGELAEYAVFNAYADGEGASTATLIVSDDVAGIYNVATPEGFRRQGFGDAATRAAVNEGRARGCTIATLQSSAMGFGVYERMGFSTVGFWRSMTPSAAPTAGS